MANKKFATKSSRPAATPTIATETVIVAPKPAVVVPTTRPVRKPTHDEIAKRAFEIWVAKGRPHGKDAENWQQAERELSKA